MIRTPLLAASFLALVCLPAFAAETVCGVKADSGAKGHQAAFGDITAICQSGGACELATQHRKKDAPNGWSHAVSVVRDKTGASWRVLLTATEPAADRANPFILVVDRDPGIYVPPTRIKGGGSASNFVVEAANDVVAGFKPGKQLEWLYYEKDNPPEIHNAVLPLKGIKAALDWADCMQKPAPKK